MILLTPEEIAERLAGLPGWTCEDAQLRRQVTLPSFHRAIAFVVQIGMLADAADHHPDIDIRYNRIAITLSTHSAGGVTERDFALAGSIEEALAS
jgi:4a-hydroxytetrahydrobiopterin dehydratase